MAKIDDLKLAVLSGIPPANIAKEVNDCLEYYLAWANEQYNENFEIPVVTYDLQGMVAGTASAGDWVIDLNMTYLLDPRYHDDMIKQTIPHELAHLIHRRLYPYDRSWHGRNWSAIMVRWDLPADRCHQYDTEVARVRRTRRFIYDCYCGRARHNVGLNIHNKIMRGRKYTCRECKGILRNGREVGK